MTRRDIDVLSRDAAQPVLPPVRLSEGGVIEVTVPAAPPLTEQELLERFDALAREHAEVRERETGEEVVLGDDVQVDILGYAHGRLIPFSLRTDLWMELTPQDALPGFAEALEGSAVGDSVSIELVLPADYPVASLRGTPARFLVDLLAAREVTMPDTESEEFLRELDRGSTLDEVMTSLAEELLEERGDQLWLEARNRVLDALAARLEVRLPESLILEELRRRWQAAEGEALEEKQFTPEEKAEAFEGWKQDAATRADVERRLRVSLALKAVAERDRLKLEPGDIFRVLEDHLEAYGLTAAQVREALVTPETAEPLRNLAWQQLAIDHAMSKAIVHFEDEDED